MNETTSYKERNADFLKEYATRSGVRTLHNGVLYREITKGKGGKPTPKSVVQVNYTGKLINGKVFDGTQGRPATFKLSDLIPGWKTALTEMSAGSRWEIVLPCGLAYGSRSAGIIKPYSTLIFEIQLLAIL